MSKHFESIWQTDDGLKLFYQVWEPEGEAKGVICLVHGMGEHSGRYAPMGEILTEARFSLMTFDLRGHGKSTGTRGHAPSFDAFMDDIDLLLSEAESRYPSKSRFLYGHSLGGLLVLNYALRRKPNLAGVVATSPGLHTPLTEQTLKITIAKTMGTVLPTLSMPSGLDATLISRNPEVVRIYQEDPLVHDRATLAMAKHTLEAIPWAFEHAHEFPVPLLLMHGTADALTRPSGSQEFASLVPGDCTLKLWDGLYHETHNEPEQGEVFDYLIGWLNSKM